jgi:predicted nucleic acid-binding protein
MACWWWSWPFAPAYIGRQRWETAAEDWNSTDWMSAVLLDTTVASLLHPKKKRNTLRVKYEPHMQSQILALSFQSVAELWSWAEENNWSTKQRNGLTIFPQRFLIIPYDLELAQVWAVIEWRLSLIMSTS